MNCVRGQNTVLARPPDKVSTVMPLRECSWKLAVITANAGSYSTVAIVKPSPTQIR
jgi:hypothetical protein